ncbi:MAG: protein-glutamate O-methyltransferase CheR [Oscillospiraceae bacterium]|nr:protein-glutamate O-methyltransferase CheR [Oscillospiraceae bacterium]
MKIDDRDFIRLSEYMHENYGINLSKKRTLVESRLTNPIAVAGFDNFHDYIEDALSDKSGVKIDKLITLLTTNYTYFMREDVHYKYMTNVALPEWTSRIKDFDLRIWSAGCSSGEEAYTTAMVLDDYFGYNKNKWDSTILATDISPKVLALAKAGVYPAEHLEKLPDNWARKYFKKTPDGSCEVSDALKKEVVFREFNLMGSFQKFRRKFHIIFCRNVMIYFDTQTKAQLAKKFHDSLEAGGYLFIGMSETLSGIFNGFEQIAPAIYKKSAGKGIIG